MSVIREQIEAKLSSAFAPSHLEVINESYRHHVPPGSESHFKIVIVSAQFAGERLIKRHRALYEVLGEELAGGVHALALHTYSPEEWTEQQEQAPASPACRGGDKRG